MLTDAKKLLIRAKREKKAIPAFNVSSLEAVQAVFITAHQNNYPVIIETSEGEAKYLMPEILVALCESLDKLFSVEYVIHLDRGKDLELIERCLKAGYNSIACEFGNEEYDDNVKDTLKVRKMTDKYNAQLEGAVEVVPLRYYSKNYQKEMKITSPEVAESYVKDTGIDSLVVSIGSQSGRLKNEEKLEIEVLGQINALLPETPLVLHGGSFLSEKVIVACIEKGIVKINVNSETRIAYTEKLKNNILSDQDEYAPYRLLTGVREAMSDVMTKKIKMFSNR